MRIAIGLLVVALLALLAASGYAHHLSIQLESANRIVGTLSAGIESRDAAIARLQDESAEREKSELALRMLLGDANSAARNREAKIQRLIAENETLKTWFNAALPDAVIRLQERPAFASANDYLRWLSEGYELPISGK